MRATAIRPLPTMSVALPLSKIPVCTTRRAARIRKALDDAVVRPHMPSLVVLQLRDGRELPGKVHAHKDVVYVKVALPLLPMCP